MGKARRGRKKSTKETKRHLRTEKRKKRHPPPPKFPKRRLPKSPLYLWKKRRRWRKMPKGRTIVSMPVCYFPHFLTMGKFETASRFAFKEILLRILFLHQLHSFESPYWNAARYYLFISKYRTALLWMGKNSISLSMFWTLTNPHKTHCTFFNFKRYICLSI